MIGLRHGNDLVRICASARDAESQIAERVLCIESLWKRTTLQLDFLRSVWDDLDKEYRTIQSQIIHVLIGKLTVAVSKIESLIVRGPLSTSWIKPQQVHGVKRFKYALVKESLDRVIEDFETWQKMFDPSWFLILKSSSPGIDRELKRQNDVSTSSLLTFTQTLRNTLQGTGNHERSVFLADDGLRSAHVFNIPFSSSKVAQRAGSSKLLILDSIPCPDHGNVQRLASDIRELARKLAHADPIHFGLLQCSGVIRETTSFTLVLRTVEGLPLPHSLRAKLLAGETNHSLSDRLSIAKDIAKSVSFVHTFGFVHKNVRPENILLASAQPSSLGHSFLVGFEGFRAAEGQTLKSGDSVWGNNVYRHPRRRGPKPDDYYIMQHDIYSLGVCLLEIGLWESFVVYDQDKTSLPSAFFSALLESSSLLKSAPMENLLEEVARRILPQRMGTKYARIVETCLTCLDEGNADFGDEREFQDADGILVSVRYIEKVRDRPRIFRLLDLLTSIGSFAIRKYIFLIVWTHLAKLAVFLFLKLT